MNIYIDNNILIDHEEGKKVLPRSESLNYYYSYVHIQELMESGTRFEQLKDRRIRTIMEQTGNKCCQNNDNYEVELATQDPRVFLLALLKNSACTFLQERIREAAQHWFDGKNPDTIMKYYGIEKSRINNYTPEELMEEYHDFIEYYVHSSDDGMVMSAFQSFFNVMDMLGFWQDKRTPRSNLARSYDANHAYFASACDYFVTNDKRTRNKANVLYYYFGLKTKAVTFDEFQQFVK